MKTLTTTIIVVMSLFATLDSSAQRTKYVRTETDTTFTINTRREHIVFKGEEAIKKRRQNNEFKTWGWAGGKFMGVNLMYCGLIQNPATMQLPADASMMNLGLKSIGVDLNFIDAVIYSRGNFGIVTGMGLECNNFRFTNNISLATDGEGNTIIDNTFTERGIHLSKSKLTTTYLNVPLLFQYHFDRHRIGWNGDGFISVGVVVGMRLQSYTKTDSPELGKQRHMSDFTLNNFHVGFQATIGYNCFAVTAKYYPQSIFRSGTGPNVQQVNIGFGLIF